LASDLGAHLRTALGDRPALVLVETEFNKNDVATYEPMDGYLVDVIAAVRATAPSARIVLALGNWNAGTWATWDRAAAASDALGVQALSALTRNTPDHAARLFDDTLNAARRLQELFGKPIVVQDVAVASYPEPDALPLQEAALQRFADGLPQLKDAGVEAILYRSLRDVPNMPIENYYGEGEKHFGLAWPSGALKPAGRVWQGMVEGERSPT
jgi:hypothetical protein